LISSLAVAASLARVARAFLVLPLRIALLPLRFRVPKIS